ncbi:MAG: hypothetical protein K1X53_08220 [Candidatus Sumerlaeaceae bacterium]|nr:hypothetical protein [Candidatus Sumerlaeaceae bacterium]
MDSIRGMKLLAVVAALAIAGLTSANAQEKTSKDAKPAAVKQAPAKKADKDDNKEEAHSHEGHHHVAPHGGTLVPLGAVGNLEVVVDPKTGSISGYVVDGCAENSIRIAQDSITLKIEDKEPFEVVLKAVTNELTGEKVGSTSQFDGQSDRLKKRKEFKGTIVSVKLKGKTYKDVGFAVPAEKHD